MTGKCRSRQPLNWCGLRGGFKRVSRPSAFAIQFGEQRRQQMLERLPQRRFPTPEDIAAAVAYLASPAAAAVTGHILPVDAGLLAV